MNPLCSHCGSHRTQSVPAVVCTALNDKAAHLVECVHRHYGVRPLSERLALPPKPTLAECFLAGASIFIGEEGELGDKLTLGAPEWARNDYAELSAKWEVQRMLWERLWYCEGCDSVFDPETRQYEASEDLAILLRT